MLASAVLETILQNMQELIGEVVIFEVNLFLRSMLVWDWFFQRFKKIFLFVWTPTATDMNDIKTDGEIFWAANWWKYFSFNEEQPPQWSVVKEGKTTISQII